MEKFNDFLSSNIKLYWVFVAQIVGQLSFDLDSILTKHVRK